MYISKRTPNLLGKRFGRLIVKCFEGYSNSDKKYSLWRCRCDCGEEKIIRGGALTSGNTNSCGCLSKENRKALNFKSPYSVSKIKIGDRRNFLKILHQVENQKGKHRQWKCLCECGNQIVVNTSQFLYGSVKSCGCKRYVTGSKNKKWKGYEDISGSMISQIKQGAKKRGIIFNLNLKFLWDLFLKQNKKCALSGKELKFYSNTRERVNGIGTASLDRIDSSKGYVKGNVQWVHKDVNYMKQDFSQVEFIQLCQEVICQQTKKNL